MKLNYIEKENDNILNILAKQMLKNHIRSSINFDYETSEIDNISKVVSQFESRRIVVVVGAAASFEAGVPNSNMAVELLKKKLNIDTRRLDKDIERLSTVYRLRPTDFETQLLAISYQSGFELRNQLKEIFFFKHVPILSYEILAHLLKHRFVDAIINFNFDELLDQAIDDEFGGGKYCKVISDGDSPEDDIDIFTEPIYIKPHGTSSHPSSLRYTREDYFGLPKGIKDFVEKILSFEPVVIFSIGFAMESFEFNQMALKAHKPSEIFYLNVKEPEPEPKLKNYVSHIIKIPKDKEVQDISPYLEQLWEILSNLFLPYYKPRIISRHCIVSNLFSLRQSLMDDTQFVDQCKDQNNNESYFKNRTIIEVIIFIARAKGLVNMGSLKSGRSGKYFDLYLKETKKNVTNLDYVKSGLTLPKICRELGFKEWEYGQETFILETLNERRKLTDEEFTTWVANLKNNSFVNSIFNKTDFKKDFFQHILSVFKETEVEITYGRSAQHEKVFENPVAMNTFTSLKWHTLKILETDWDFMLVVAETGEWLTQNEVVEIINKDQGKKVFLLIADQSYADQLKKDLKIEPIIKILPWWVHNKHMTICCKNLIDDPNNQRSGIYFIRRMRSPIIDAVKLEGNDCDIILNIFYSYWAKAKKREDDKLDTVGHDDISRAMSEIFS